VPGKPFKIPPFLFNFKMEAVKICQNFFFEPERSRATIDNHNCLEEGVLLAKVGHEILEEAGQVDGQGTASHVMRGVDQQLVWAQADVPEEIVVQEVLHGEGGPGLGYVDDAAGAASEVQGLGDVLGPLALVVDFLVALMAEQLLAAETEDRRCPRLALLAHVLEGLALPAQALSADQPVLDPVMQMFPGAAINALHIILQEQAAFMCLMLLFILPMFLASQSHCEKCLVNTNRSLVASSRALTHYSVKNF
jgi:hypothetical protein